MSKIVSVLKKVLADLADLRRTATAAAVVAFATQFFPALGVNGQVIAGVIASVGAAAYALERYLKLA